MNRRAAIAAWVGSATLAAAAGLWFGMERFKVEPQTANTSLLFAQNWPDANGQMVAMEQFRGQPLVVNFWATWCPPCVEEIPEFSRLHTEYTPKGVRFVGIAIDNAGNVADFSKKIPASYPYLVAGAAGTELARRLGNTAGALPYTLVLKPDGGVHAVKLGRLHERELRQMLDTLPSPPLTTSAVENPTTLDDCLLLRAKCVQFSTFLGHTDGQITLGAARTQPESAGHTRT